MKCCFQTELNIFPYNIMCIIIIYIMYIKYHSIKQHQKSSDCLATINEEMIGNKGMKWKK